MSNTGRTITMAILLLVSSCAFTGVSWGQDAPPVSRTEVDAIRAKSVIGESDMAAIRSFVQQNMQAILNAASDTEIAAPLERLLGATASISTVQQAKQAYAETFAAAVKIGYGDLVQKAARLDDPKLAEKIELAAAMVVAQTDHVTLIDELLLLAQDKLPAVRYWAFKGLAMPSIAEYLFGSPNAQTKYVSEVLSALSQAVDKEDEAAVLAEIAVAATPLAKYPQGTDVLTRTVAKRVERYQSWSVQEELWDLEIISQILFAATPNTQVEVSAESQKQLMFQAATLYTAAYDRYLKGTLFVQDDQGQPIKLLPSVNLAQLQNVLIEGEMSFLQATNTVRSSRFATAIQKGKRADFSSAYNALLGNKGIVNRTYSIFSSNTGDEQTEIPFLPDPPQSLIDRAKIMQRLSEDAVTSNLF